MKPAVVVNPASNGGGAGRRWPELARLLAQAIGPLDVQFTQYPGHAVELAAQAAAAGCDPVIAAGGDGTLNEVVNGLMGANQTARLAVIPMGSGGDFARTVGLGNPVEAIEAIAAGQERCIDLIRVEYKGLDGSSAERFVLNIAGFGLGAEAVRGVRRWHSLLPRSARYLAAAIPVLAAGYSFPLTLRMDEQPAVQQEAALVAVANGQFQGSGIHIAPRARLDDALLDVTMIDPVSLTDVAWNAGLLYNGRIYGHPNVHHRRVARLQAESSARVLLELDGEVCGTLPLRAEVFPAALRVIIR